MEKLENRNNVRLTNQIEILNILRKSHSTITDLADKLDISFTAAKNILVEAIKQIKAGAQPAY